MEPDPLEKKIRFGCGFIFGLVVGLLEFARIVLYSSTGMLIVAIVIIALVCGLLALKYGDRFWHFLLERVRWWM